MSEMRPMSDYLVIGGWSGRRKIPVDIIGETPDSFQIKPLERVFVPGRGILKKGQSTQVSKSVIKLAETRDQQVEPANMRARSSSHTIRFLTKVRETLRSLMLSR
jgi:hypothetical protein